MTQSTSRLQTPTTEARALSPKARSGRILQPSLLARWKFAAMWGEGRGRQNRKRTPRSQTREQTLTVLSAAGKESRKRNQIQNIESLCKKMSHTESEPVCACKVKTPHTPQLCARFRQTPTLQMAAHRRTEGPGQQRQTGGRL